MKIRHLWYLLLTALIHTFTPAIGTGQENDYPLFLKETMVSDESFWVRVHAAEALILNNFPVDVRTAFSDKLNVEGPEKVGILRMLYHSAGRDSLMMDSIVQELVNVFYRTSDHRTQLTALETMGKLGLYLPNVSEIGRIASTGESGMQ